jgi:DNA-binding transcriptional MerR regulator
MPHTLTKSQIASILRMGRAGKSINAICKAVRCSRQTASKYLDAHGIAHNHIRRFSAAEDENIRADYFAWVPVKQTAAKLRRSHGVIRQRINFLGLHRSQHPPACNGAVTQVLKWAPEHLRQHLLDGTLAPDQFLTQCHHWRDQQQQQLLTLRQQQQEHDRAALVTTCVRIFHDQSLPRNAKMRAMRDAGATLESIADYFGVTRERTRQLTSEQYQRKVESEKATRRALRMVRYGDRILERKQRMLRLWHALPEIHRLQFLSEIGATLISEQQHERASESANA